MKKTIFSEKNLWIILSIMLVIVFATSMIPASAAASTASEKRHPIVEKATEVVETTQEEAKEAIEEIVEETEENTDEKEVIKASTPIYESEYFKIGDKVVTENEEVAPVSTETTEEIAEAVEETAAETEIIANNDAGFDEAWFAALLANQSS